MLKEKLIKDPDRCFADPDEVVNSSLIKKKEKFQALRVWREKARKKQKNSYQGLKGNPVSQLSQVLEALKRLRGKV